MVVKNAQFIEFLRNYLVFLKNYEAYGLMTVRFAPKGLNRGVKPLKLYHKFQYSALDDVEKFLLDFERKAEEATKEPYSNWYFTEFTKITKSLEEPSTTVSNVDFKGHKKVVVYFDMDIKDQVTKEQFLCMSKEEKKVFLTASDNFQKLKNLEPVYIIFTGNGFHIGFLLNEIVSSEKSYKEGYTLALQKLSNITGWEFDKACANVARIDRLPFTKNIKGEAPSDVYAETVYLDWKASDKFLMPMKEILQAAELEQKINSSTIPDSMYSVLPRLKDYNYEVYSYLKNNLTFHKLFDYFKMVEKVNYRFPTAESKGFLRCYSPFREETLPSFGYDETTKKFFDFGQVPGLEGDTGKGDIVGLAYALFYKQVNNAWPADILPMDAKDVALKIISGKTEEQIRKECTEFSRDEMGKVVADYDTVLTVFLNYITNKYELVYNVQQDCMMFRLRNTEHEFQIFPDDCSEFGSKNSTAIARNLLGNCGASVVPGALASTATQAVDYIKDKRSLLPIRGEDLKFTNYDYKSVNHIKVAIQDISNPVIKFTNGLFYKIKTGEIVTSYEGFSYSVNAKYVDYRLEKLETPNWDSLLQSLTGPSGSKERNALNFILAQMWLPAHGDSRALLIKGNGRNGKSSLSATLTGIMPKGTYYTCDIRTLSGSSTSSESTRVNLIGKHLVFVKDMEKYDIDLQLKSIITGDEGLTARLLYKNTVSFKNMASFIFMANSFPIINEDTSAFLRRFIMIESKFRVKDAIRDIQNLIIKNEIDGVWQYIIKCIDEFRKYDFLFPEKEEWAKSLIEPMKRALINQTAVGEVVLSLEPSPGEVVDLRALHEAYLSFSEKNKAAAMQYKTFAQKIVTLLEDNNELVNMAVTQPFSDSNMTVGITTIYRSGQPEVLINCIFNAPVQNLSVCNTLTLKDTFSKYNTRYDEWVNLDDRMEATQSVKQKIVISKFLAKDLLDINAAKKEAVTAPATPPVQNKVPKMGNPEADALLNQFLNKKSS